MRLAAACAETSWVLGLLDGCFLGGDLMCDAGDGRLLGRDFAARGVDGEPVVAVVDRGDHVAGMDVGVVGDRDAGDIAGDFGGERRVVGLHIGVVGRDREAPDRHVVVAEPAADAGRQIAIAPSTSLRRLRRGGRSLASGVLGAASDTVCRAVGGAGASVSIGGAGASSTFANQHWPNRHWLTRLRRSAALPARNNANSGAAVPVLVAIHAPHSSGSPAGSELVTEPFGHQ